MNTNIGSDLEDPILSKHARHRMASRGIPAAAVAAALDYGQVFHERGATMHVIGREEVKRLAADGVDLAAYKSIQVVCANDGTVLTVYWNHKLHSLRQSGKPARNNLYETLLERCSHAMD